MVMIQSLFLLGHETSSTSEFEQASKHAREKGNPRKLYFRLQLQTISEMILNSESELDTPTIHNVKIQLLKFFH